MQFPADQAKMKKKKKKKRKNSAIQQFFFLGNLIALAPTYF